MEAFTWNESFKHQLRSDAHRYGEVLFLGSVLKPGMTVVEGGAHSGVTAASIAEAVGRNGHVYAFEPVEEYFSQLRKNMKRNGISNITILNLALGDKKGYVPIFKHGEGSGVTRVDPCEEVLAYATTIDEFIKTHDMQIDFINLDCEGSELNVLRGAKALLGKTKPGIFCEVHRDYLNELSQSVKDVVGFLRGIGYSVKPIQVEQLEAKSDFDGCSHIYAEGKNAI